MNEELELWEGKQAGNAKPIWIQTNKWISNVNFDPT